MSPVVCSSCGRSAAGPDRREDTRIVPAGVPVRRRGRGEGTSAHVLWHEPSWIHWHPLGSVSASGERGGRSSVWLERQVVALEAAGSNPVAHPRGLRESIQALYSSARQPEGAPKATS